MMAERKTLVLIDGHALAYRAFFALPPDMATSKGELTNATYGFAVMLLNVLEQIKPDYIAAAFDVGKTFRHDRYPEYKGHRAKSPSELDLQMERIYELVRAFNIPVFTAEGYEADDVLGTLAHQAEQAGVAVVIVTGDTDAFQLVGDHIRVMTSGRRFGETIIYDESKIEERYGLEPERLVDYKGLIGDTSDNIPGIRGVGDKTATTLLQQYGSIENIYNHLDEIKGRFHKALAGHRDEALLSKELATIRTDAPVTLDLVACRTRNFDRETVMDLFRTLEFRSLVDRVPAVPTVQTPEAQAEAAKAIEVDYRAVDSEESLADLDRALAKSGAVTFDVETDDLDPIRANLVGLALCVAPGQGYYIPIAHRPPNQRRFEGPGDEPQNLPLARVLEVISPWLADERIATRAHNAKFDLIVLKRHGFNVTNVDFDTMIAEWIINPGTRNYGLKGLAWQRLSVEMTPITDLIGSGKNQITMDQVPVAQVAPYAAADVDMTCRLVDVLERELRAREQWQLFTAVEMPLVPVLVDMEMAGITLDVEQLTTLDAELHARMAELEAKIYEYAGYEFNINSGPQLSEVLFNQLSLSKQATSKTKQGYYSTAANVLEALKNEHPIIALLLEHRHLSKLLSTYVEQLPLMVNPETGRIHTDYSQTAAETGRLSSSNPNLQNIPARTDIGRRVRRAFVAAPGCVLLSADYSQVELRVLAHLSQDPGMLAAFQRGEDIHAATASTILGVPISEVTRQQRELAKRVNFGLLYGMSAWRLAREASIPYEEAEAFLKRYFESFPSIERFLDDIVEQARDRGYTETILGRRRYFPELRGDTRVHQNVRAAAERAAKNMPIQGSAADIIKIAMIDLHEALHDFGLRTRMLLQVHDELVFELPENELEEAATMIPQIMSAAYELTVPLKVDTKVGYNWEEMISLEEFTEEGEARPAGP
ncbi:MAG: DNA polymerase I [Ardenticatenaceae bacterium]|nr:DNA polymerase I [Ardenticatenaceae bacterium]